MFPEKRELIQKIIKLRNQEREKLKQKVRERVTSVPLRIQEIGEEGPPEN